MRRLDDRAAPAGSAYPVLAMVGVLGLGCVAVHANDESARGKVLQDLQEHADDSRREIRDAVAVALELCLKELPSETLAHLETWKDGYFHSELMLRAVFQPAVLQRVNDVQAPLSRLQESFALAAGAPRAHQRSQGYRALLKTMTVAISELGKRFPQPVMRWLKENATVATKDLLAALNDALDQLRAAGLRSGDAQAVRDALDSAVPPPRDPRWDVGPTRERGRKARIKGRRRKA